MTSFSNSFKFFALSLICASSAFGKPNSALIASKGPRGNGAQSEFPLHDLIVKVNGERVKGYIQIEAKKNKQSLEQTNRLGDTPLHTAVYTKNYSALEALIAAGADINALNPNTGTSPLFIAQARKDTEALFILLKAGAKSQNGRPLSDAAQIYENNDALKKSATQSLRAMAQQLDKLTY